MCGDGRGCSAKSVRRIDRNVNPSPRTRDYGQYQQTSRPIGHIILEKQPTGKKDKNMDDGDVEAGGD